MKFVAATDFSNVKKFGIKTDKLKHPNHIHKGHEFTVGDSDILEQLGEEQKFIVGTLIKHKLAILDVPENAARIEQVKKEVKAAEEADAARAKAAPQLSDVLVKILEGQNKILETLAAKK